MSPQERDDVDAPPSSANRRQYIFRVNTPGMIRINGFVHRAALCDLIRRWMLNRPEATDRRRLLQLVYFNNIFVHRYLPLLSEALLTRLHQCELRVRRAPTKGNLKDQIVSHSPCPDARVAQLIDAYRRNPGQYFRETPFQGMVYFCAGEGGEAYVASSRIKRVRRLAEKTARRLVDWIYGEIQRQARSMTLSGGSSALSVSADSEPSVAPGTEGFRRAEKQILDQLRDEHPPRLVEYLEINDVAGIKCILEAGEEARLQQALQELGCRIVEREYHVGDYTATNLVVDYYPDKDHVLSLPLPDQVIRVFVAHGMSENETRRAFEQFVREGEAGVRVEIIVSDYAQMLESEIGRCMHEERIIRQRLDQEYRGQLAVNLEFLMEYLFMLPAAPGVEDVETLPIRLWDRYLPDYFDEVKSALFNIPSVELNAL